MDVCSASAVMVGRGYIVGLVGVGALAALYYANQEKAGEIVDAVVDLTKPRGIRLNNPGNIDWIADAKKRWNGMVRIETRVEAGGKTPRFGYFESPAYGVRAIGKELLLDVSRGVDTVYGLISAWAPPSENNTKAYAAAVAKEVGVGAKESIDVRAKLPRIAAAIIRHENGQQPYAMADIERWVFLA